MEILRYPDNETLKRALQRPQVDAAVMEAAVAPILSAVRSGGDAAVRRFTRQFDGVAIAALEVPAEEMQSAGQQVSDALKSAIRQAHDNIEKFHRAQLRAEEEVETASGVRCWRTSVGIEKVGLYIPGGSAPLFSTILMLAIPATIAGCKEIILCTPPAKDGNIHPAILYTCTEVGVKRIYRCGGAQAIAAMAYGTETIPRVDKIFGPGNQYVTAAKMAVSREGVAIDMPAGPSEVLVVADQTTRADFAAADLLSQAEHGPDSQVMLVSTDEKKADAVLQEIEQQCALLPRKEIARQALQNSKAIVVKNMDEALEISNRYAPEHLILAVDNASDWVGKIANAGSVFLGHFSPESAGDYASGTNHTLPTNGYARAYSGVSVDSFVKKITFQELSREGLRNIGPAIEEMAGAEDLQAHKMAVSVRLAYLKNNGHV